MNRFFFVSDLHGRVGRYRKLFDAVAREKPEAVFMGGDLFPHGMGVAFGDDSGPYDFVPEFLATEFGRLKDSLGASYPRVFLILGNDDARAEESAVAEVASRGIWEYIHKKRVDLGVHPIYGYSFVPPTPFMLKDWERYDVSRGVDPGCVSPEEGFRTVSVPTRHTRFATIQNDLEQLTGEADVSRAIFLFHAPPYKSKLDRAALDGKMIDHVPLDVHIGSIAVRRFIESRKPMITLHGHVHESARLTGSWSEQIGDTWSFSAAHDGPELALVHFDPERPERAERVLL